MKVHIVQLVPDPSVPDEIVVLGVFSTPEKAAAECRDRRYIVVSLDLDVCLSHDSIDTRCEEIRPSCRAPDPALQAKQMGLMAQTKAQRRCPRCGGTLKPGQTGCRV
jgi:hypothetical protein